MNTKLIVNIILIAVTVNLVPVLSHDFSSTLVQYQDYLIAGIISVLIMPFVKPLFE